MGKNQCPPWLLMMFLKIQHQSLSVKKNVHSFPVKKSLFHESLLCMYPSNDICMEKSSQNINYSGALRTPKCVSPDSWKSWDISTQWGKIYFEIAFEFLIASNITRYFRAKKKPIFIKKSVILMIIHSFQEDDACWAWNTVNL